MNIYDDLPFPSRIEPLPYMLVVGAALIIGALSFVGNALADRQHKAHHEAINAAVIAEAATHCPPETRITILKIDGERHCITELQRTYGMADRRVYVAAK